MVTALDLASRITDAPFRLDRLGSRIAPDRVDLGDHRPESGPIAPVSMVAAFDGVSRIAERPLRLDRLGRRIEVGAGDLQRYDA